MISYQLTLTMTTIQFNTHASIVALKFCHSNPDDVRYDCVGEISPDSMVVTILKGNHN